MPRPYFNNKNKVKEILMVNHAGEFGAQQIYKGQLAFTKNSNDRNIIRHMLDEELEHLKYFENKIGRGESKPTMLLPLWNIFGYAVGAVSAIAGPKTSMLVTEGIEEVIVRHYDEQIEYLSQGNDPSNDLSNNHNELLSKIKQFRAEEAEHIQIAINNDSRNALFHNATLGMVKRMCNIAIYLSKRI